MLRACIIDFGGSWDSHLPLAEFSYNNSHHTKIGMPPYEMLYGRRCRTPVCWGEIGQKELGSLEVVRETSERFDQIKARMKAAQGRQKSYADRLRRPIEFDVGDRVMLKVSPWKGIIRFRKRGKLSPRFIGPFRIMARVGEVAYSLELPDELSRIHPTFHVSHLRKCLADESAHVPLTDIEVDNSLNYIEEPVAILDRKEKRLRNKTRMRKLGFSRRTGRAHLLSAHGASPAHLLSAQEEGSAHLLSAQEEEPAHLLSAQEDGPAHLLSAQEAWSAHLLSAQAAGSAHLLSAQTSELMK
ncbi:hypothetical protein L1987_33063 [Smallanthus sonchifolius]|uniref:Uncharacterized protein n=1 Tax=Smallanthus sonchifolius TaxID=185202 RepID=A0ACB9HRB4_9ASTR|nr:hypothetical protein L1987_33063 [Smallanthus sonchifolius]